MLGSSAAKGTFDLAGFSQTVASLGTGPSAAAANQTIGNSAASSTATLTINGSSTYGGSIQDEFNGGGGTASTVAAGLVYLSGSNTYTGPTTIATAGTFHSAATPRIGAGANAGNLVANGLLDLAGYHATVNTLSGSGTVGDSGGGGSLTFGNNASSTFSGLLTGGNNTNLTKNGAGTFVLTGTNVVANTMINQGTYQIGNGVLNGSAGSATQYNIAPVRGSISTKAPAPTPPSPGAASPAAGRWEYGQLQAGVGGVLLLQPDEPALQFHRHLAIRQQWGLQYRAAGLGQAATVVIGDGRLSASTTARTTRPRFRKTSSYPPLPASLQT